MQLRTTNSLLNKLQGVFSWRTRTSKNWGSKFCHQPPLADTNAEELSKYSNAETHHQMQW